LFGKKDRELCPVVLIIPVNYFCSAIWLLIPSNCHLNWVSVETLLSTSEKEKPWSTFNVRFAKVMSFQTTGPSHWCDNKTNLFENLFPKQQNLVCNGQLIVIIAPAINNHELWTSKSNLRLCFSLLSVNNNNIVITLTNTVRDC